MGAAILTTRERRTLVPIVLAIAFTLSAQVLFWAFTYPANVATENWTVQPDSWATLRRRWEYSHAAGASLQVLALCLLLITVLGRGQPARM